VTPASVQRRVRALLAGALLTLLAVPIVSAAGPSRLQDGASAGTGAARSFEVTYISRDDAAPSWVRVVVAGSARAMQPVDPQDTTYRDGARFRASLTLPAGTHVVAFSALDSRERRTLSLPGDPVTIAAPVVATPRPTPHATAAPTKPPAPDPSPTPRPAATLQPTPEPTPDLTPAPTAAPSAAPVASVEPSVAPTRPPLTGPALVPPGLAAEPAPVPALAPGAGPRAGHDRGSPGDAPTADPQPSEPPQGAGTVDPGPPTAPPPTPWDRGPGPDARTLPQIVSDAAALPAWGTGRWLQLATWGATTSTTAGTVTALALFALRRRRESEAVPQEVEHEPSVTRAIAPHLAHAEGEEHMPRWRRPSLLAARRSTPEADPSAMAAQRLTFDRAAVERDTTRERRWIRYRMVRLSDGPDELMSTELGRLDAGDEVELLERSGTYWQVRTPTGHVGWVHRMTLGDVVDAGSDRDARPLSIARQPVSEPSPHDGLAARLISERAARA
jgi:hypothetical protein